MVGKVKPLTERDLETLSDLAVAHLNLIEVGYHDGWARTMDCGGTDASYHSSTLTKLVKRGVACVRDPSKKRPGRSIYMRGGNGYKISQLGLEELKRWGKYASLLRRLKASAVFMADIAALSVERARQSPAATDKCLPAACVPGCPFDS